MTSNANIQAGQQRRQMSDLPRKSVETFVFRALTQAALVVAGIITARILGPYGKGVFAYVSNVFLLLLAFNDCQSAAISWQYGRLKRPSGEVLAAMMRILAFGGISAALIVIAVSLTLQGQRPLIADAFALPFAFFSQMATAFYLADGKVRTQNIQNLIRAMSFMLGLVPALMVFRLGIPGMLAVWVLAWVGSATYAFLMLRPYAAASAHDGGAVHVKEQVVFGLKASANSLAALLNFNIDIYIVLFILGPKALGVYAVAIGAGQGMWQLTQPLAVSAYGRINSGSRVESMNLTAKCVRHSLIVVGASCVLLFFIGPSLITTLYGAPFRDAGAVLRFLLPGIVAYSMVPFFSAFFSQQLGKPLVLVRILSISTIICAAITLATIRPLGIAAGAIATSASYLTALILCVILFLGETGMSLKTLFGFTRDDIRPYRALAASFWKHSRSRT